jgi:hypothetical protein
MGAIRKLTSMSSLGLVDFRSDKERTAATPAPAPAAPADLSAEQAMRTLMGQTSSIAEPTARARCRELLDEVDAIFRAN